ncbi:MAG TPA: T9SS type A sorting domain-containing protein, partial [Melioribacteraceae bacterium]|nr:T9SS type A sorting domain-containing protein [Melioribacteraceae bacterium]
SYTSVNRIVKFYDLLKRYNQIVLPSVVFLDDSTKKLTYTYDNNGNGVSEITEDFVNNNWLTSKKIFVSFDTNGKLLTYKEEYLDNGIWTIYSDIINNYDPNGNLILEEYRNFYQGELVSGVIANTFNSNNLIISSLNERVNGNLKENFELIEYSYNSDNKLTNKVVKTWSFNQQWVNSFQEFFNYNNNGLLETYISQSWEINKWKNLYKENYTYNNLLKISEKINEITVGENWLNDSRETFTYNANGILSNYQEDIWQINAWVNFSKVEHLYNQNGNLIISRRENYVNNAWQPASKIYYSYNEENNFIGGSCLIFVNDSWIPGIGVFMATYNNGQDTLYYFGKNINIDLINISEAENINNNISSFSLSQNYPNPFNPSTNISFTLPKSDFVTLKVYDILGKEIATLINQELNAGSYIKPFNATNLSSGIYFYKLQASKYSQTKKMILIK